MENKMVGWHQQLNGHESVEALGVADGQEAWCAAIHAFAELHMTK